MSHTWVEEKSARVRSTVVDFAPVPPKAEHLTVREVLFLAQTQMGRYRASITVSTGVGRQRQGGER